MTDPSLVLVRRRPDLAALAAFPFDFDLDRAEHGEEVHLASGAALEPIAGDDTGGTFFLCGGNAVLYADSEGGAGLLADSVTDALDIVVGLPAWRDLMGPDPGPEEIRELEDGMRTSYAPDLDARRTELRTALGLPARSPAELVARLHAALLRTDPDHLLLNSQELLAYELLDRLPRHPERSIGPVRREVVRASLIRRLDDTGPDPEQLGELGRELERIGEYAQAARAQRGFLSLQNSAWDRAAAGHVLARRERSAGDLAAAGRTLARVRTAIGLDSPAPPPSHEQRTLDLGAAGEPPAPDASAEEWHRRGLGRMITEEHLELVLAAIAAGETGLARDSMAHAHDRLAVIAKQFRQSLGDLPARAKWAVARLPKV
ncbi:hypothetical protein [Streptomyces sp. NPDC008141]|uniref:hypothetical protein n=1 Tax=Streptomyces sp. NPDC008141 TaxID=3364815 RepID=UPI0036E0A637